MDDVPTENVWGNMKVTLVSKSQQNVVFKSHCSDHTYLCPLAVWMINPLPRNLKPPDA